MQANDQQTSGVSGGAARRRCGIIGMGKIGRLYRRLFQTESKLMQRFLVVGVADPKAPAQQMPEVRLYEDHSQLLKETECDVVIVATPPDSHFSIAKDALLSGANVLVEKPPVRSVAQAKELIRIAREVERVLFFGYHARYNHAVLRAKEEIGCESICKAEMCYKEDAFRFHSPDSWVFSEGPVRDSGINAISILTQILPTETPLKVTGAWFPRRTERGVIVSARAEFRLGKSGTASLEIDWDYAGPEIRDIFLKTDRHHFRIDVVHDSLEKDDQRIDVGTEGGGLVHEYSRMLVKFAECLDSRSSLAGTNELRIITAIHCLAKHHNRN